MTPGTSRVLTVGLASALAIGYAVLAHVSNAVPGNEGLGLVLSVGPLWLIAATMAWRSDGRVAGLIACAIAALLIFLLRAELEQHYPWIYLGQQIGTYGLLGLLFGRTLFGGRVPLCTQFALIVHGSLPPEAADYARRVTIAWTVFFAAMVMTLLVLFIAASLPLWSAFANFGAASLVALMFVAEHWIRRRALPALPRTSLQATIRAFTAHRPVIQPELKRRQLP
jgi:uncharacterized membrane protein